MPTWTDEAMVEGFRRGEDSAVEAYFRKYGPRLLYYLQAETADARDAEDLMHDLLRKAAESWRPDGGRALKNWIYFLARHALADYHAQRSPYIEVSYEELEEGPLPLPAELRFEQPDDAPGEPAPDPRLERVLALVEHLPPRLKQTTELTLRGYSHEQIASYSGVKPATVRVQLHRSIKTLRLLDETVERGQSNEQTV